MKYAKLLIAALVLVLVLYVLDDRFRIFGGRVITPVVTLTISAQGLDFTGNTRSGLCNTSTHLACLRIPNKDTARINYRLVGRPSWGFTRIQLVHSGPKLDFGDQTGFTQDMKDDFYVKYGNEKIIVPDENGIIDLTDLPDIVRNFVLTDNNVYEQTYRYQIQVCKGPNKDVDCEPSDPKIENEGNK